jgi:hypothetical protein
MMDAMTVEEKVRAAQHGRVFPSEAANRIAFLNANPLSGRHAITRQVMALGSETTQA